MFTIITAIDTVKVFHSLADALTFCSFSFDACGFAPRIKDENMAVVAYAFDAENVAYATNTSYAHSGFNSYFARQGM